MHDERCEYPQWIGALRDRMNLSRDEVQALRTLRPSLCYCKKRRIHGEWSETTKDREALVDQAVKFVALRRRRSREDADVTGKKIGDWEEKPVEERGGEGNVRAGSMGSEVPPNVILVDFKKRRRINLSEG